MQKSSPGLGKFGRRRFLRAVLSLAVFALALPSRIAAAHASLVKSEPSDGELLKHLPSRVTAWFEQELDATASTIAVFDAQERQVDDGRGGVDLNDPDHASMTAMLSAALAAGRYTVRWSARSAADGHLGHTSSGEFAFEIG